jgi:hypothetical protein
MPHYPGGPEVSGRWNARPGQTAAGSRLVGPDYGSRDRHGEIGTARVLLTPEFGPRVRIGMILTDAELEPDPVLPTGPLQFLWPLRDRLPGNAIPRTGKRTVDVSIQVGSEKLHWGDVDMGRCR